MPVKKMAKDLSGFNELEMLATMEILHIYSHGCRDRLIVESDSPSAISWMNLAYECPWKFFYHFEEIKWLSSSFKCVFNIFLPKKKCVFNMWE